MEIKSVLIPSAVADVCFLQEALYWLTLRRFPIRVDSPYFEDDGRHDDQWSNGLIRNVSHSAPSKDECGLVGLPPHPITLGILQGEYIPSKRLAKWLEKENDQAIILDGKAEMAITMQYERELATWERAFDSRSDVEKARLFIALRDGMVLATGKQIKDSLLQNLISEERDRESEYVEYGKISHDSKSSPTPDWTAVAREPISVDFWASRNIQWDYSCAQGDGHGFALILLQTRDLFRAFPIVELEGKTSVYRVGDVYVPEDGEGHVVSLANSGGRKSFPWGDFHVEMAKRVRDGRLEPKQEVMIGLMQQWCKEKWNIAPGRSTISQMLKPYFDEFIRGGER